MMPVQRADAPVYDDGPRAAPDDQLEAASFTALADPAQPRLVFQPIVDLHSGDIVGYETLSRFISPLGRSATIAYALVMASRRVPGSTIASVMTWAAAATWCGPLGVAAVARHDRAQR